MNHLRKKEWDIRKLLERRIAKEDWPIDVGVIRCPDERIAHVHLDIHLESDVPPDRSPAEIVDTWMTLFKETVEATLESIGKREAKKKL